MPAMAPPERLGELPEGGGTGEVSVGTLPVEVRLETVAVRVVELVVEEPAERSRRKKLALQNPLFFWSLFVGSTQRK